MVLNSLARSIVILRMGLMKRNLRSRLPSITKEQQRSLRTAKQKQYYDRGTKTLTEIPKGMNVKIHDGNSWSIQGQVIQKAETPRSYIVQTESGRQLRRNRQDLLVTPDVQPTAEESRQPECDVPSTSPKELDIPSPDGPPDNPPERSPYVTRCGGVVRPPVRFQDT